MFHPIATGVSATGGVECGCIVPALEDGADLVGCVYTTQGFEYDYAGVIFGRDLRYDPRTARWIGDLGVSYDTVVKRAGDNFIGLVKNTYRVLLTRGMKRCYVYFMDDDTRNFFRSRIE